MFYDQNSFDIRFEWGANGIMHLAPVTDVFIIVDVLSFSTCVDIAAARGAWIYPYHGDDAAAFADQIGGIAAIHPHDIRPGDGQYALSPASLVDIPAGTKLILPSPNGSTLSTLTGNIPTFAGCFRNAWAVAVAAAGIAQKTGHRITLIAAGEKWGNDHSLRPAIEDLTGCGAIIHHLSGSRSPEAQIAEAAFLSVQTTLSEMLQTCSSGRELIEKGRTTDVLLAAALCQSDAAPRLIDGAYRFAQEFSAGVSVDKGAKEDR